MRRLGQSALRRRSGGAIRPVAASGRQIFPDLLGELPGLEDIADVAEAGHGPRGLKPSLPTVVLVDVPTGFAGVELLRTIQRRSPHARLLLLAVGAEDPPSRGEGPNGHAGTPDGLTTREQEILDLLATGRTNRDIADSLSISAKTVKTHLGNIFRKLGITRRVQAAVYATRRES